MPITYQIDPELGLVYREFKGSITLDVLAQHYRDLLSDPNAEGMLAWVTDMRDCTLELRGDDVQSLVDRTIRPLMCERRWHCAAIVRTEVQYGLTSQFALFSAECGETKVFYDLPEAIDWAAAFITEGRL